MSWFGIAGRAFVRRNPTEVRNELQKEFNSSLSLDRLLEQSLEKTPGRFLERNGDLLQFFGTARVGKDEMAKVLREQGYQPYSFAQPLKQVGQMLFGLSDRETWDDSIKENVIATWGMTPRKIFQRLGTEGARNIFKPEIWGQLAARRWQDIRDQKSLDRPWLAPESHILQKNPEDFRDFTLRQAARIMFDLGGSPWEWSEEVLMQRIEAETIPAIISAVDMPMEKYWEIRKTLPLFAQVSIGPNVLLPEIIGMSTPDVRFEDEGQIIRADFSFTDAYLRPYPPGQVMVIHRILPDEFYEKMKENSTISHASEMGIANNPKDTNIWNDGSLNEFKEKILLSLNQKEVCLEM
ncbi:MAG TPA: hypothetical protein VIY47_05405 [Ignavibacteriaceae bacterium]